ncbi:MAG: UxaA family hydrolase [Acidimicrobiia bacterium]|nr:UxaA family hydrolase [Acidimicrobiia bacterium]MBT8214330.1 UxaA family hydrolase [Acidimicrobiia bacterium]NNF70254.1 UxaA family hydrolase [Acidimicrobiia bacterium]NNK91957.1 UxaA family hydrolase [Acidimicrobiia bacterium]
MKKGILLHESDDDVGVATMDLTVGEVIQAVTLEGDPVAEIELVDDVPLSHKVAMRDMGAEHDLIEYGRAIGSTSTDIAAGAHVHTHNLQSNRWSGRSQIVEHHGEQS